jgi:hypothetical protein
MFKFKTTLKRHNAIQNQNYYDLPDPLIFRYHLPLMLFSSTSSFQYDILYVCILYFYELAYRKEFSAHIYIKICNSFIESLYAFYAK